MLTGLRHLELRSYVLPADSLLHLALLTGLTSLRVSCHDIHELEGDQAAGVYQAPEDGPGSDGLRTTALAHLGALSGLTCLAQLSVRDRGSLQREGVQPAASLLAALPSSPFLSEVRPGLGKPARLHCPNQPAGIAGGLWSGGGGWGHCRTARMRAWTYLCASSLGAWAEPLLFVCRIGPPHWP